MRTGFQILVLGTITPTLVVLALQGTWSIPVLAIPALLAVLCMLALKMDFDTVALVLFFIWVLGVGYSIYIGM